MRVSTGTLTGDTSQRGFESNHTDVVEQHAQRGVMVGRRIDNDPELLAASYRLRYQVYCVERAFLRAADYPDQQEHDEFDRYSLHLGVIDHDGELMATSRLIEVSVFGLPLFRHCQVFPNHADVFRPTYRFAEVSRLCMSRQLANQRAVIPTMYKALYQFSKRAGYTHWLVATERGLHRLLTNFGFPFKPIGPQIDYFGPVVPYLMDFQEFDQILLSGARPHLATFFDGLEPEFHPAAYV
jgi:N-acyl-L-homoserine lactone synthetase